MPDKLKHIENDKFLYSFVGVIINYLESIYDNLPFKMNSRHIQILLNGCLKSTDNPDSYSVKIIGENKEITYVDGCVLVFIAPWLSESLNERVISFTY